MSIAHIAHDFVAGMIDQGGSRSARVCGRYALARSRHNIRATVNAFETVAVRETDGTVMLLVHPAFGAATAFERAILKACEELDVSIVYDATVELKVATSFKSLCDGMHDGLQRGDQAGGRIASSRNVAGPLGYCLMLMFPTASSCSV